MDKKWSYQYRPSPIEIFYALESVKNFVKILIGIEKPYSSLLNTLIENNFFEEADIRTIKPLSERVNVSSSKVSKWISNIYFDLFRINEEYTERFRNEGALHKLHFRYYDSYCNFSMGLKITPRKYESFDFYFVKPEFGILSFWVKNVHHEIINGQQEITIMLEGGSLNQYRETLVERALFEAVIDFFDRAQKPDFKIDEILSYPKRKENKMNKTEGKIIDSKMIENRALVNLNFKEGFNRPI